MNIIEARQALETHFIAHMETAFSTVLRVFGNDGVPTPEPVAGARWVRFNVITSNNYPAAIGNTFRRRDGFLSIEIFTIRGEGMNPSDEISSSLQNIYDGECIDSIRFTGGVVPVPIGDRDGQVWAQTNITVDIQIDNFKGA